MPELIDHILVSERSLPVGADRKRVAPQVDNYPAPQGGPLESVGDDPRKRKGKVASDHAPLVADFDV
ncbi:MAG TPA: hypothetical protein VG937_27030 [Polyangiaceae bacterium]|nr:hypothetical protein [Polyangiaceae bacterium]